LKAKKPQGSKAELRALSNAREALARGHLEEVAESYLQAARARERADEDPFPHYLKALEFWSAADHPQSGVALSRRMLKRRDRKLSRHRPLLRLRLAQLLGQLRRYAEAKNEFRLALKALSRRDTQSLQAGLGLAGSYLRLGELDALPRLLEDLVVRSQRLGDRRAEASSEFLQALTAHWSGDWTGALEIYDRVLQLVEQRGMRSVEYSCCAGISEIYLGLGMFQEGSSYAGRAHEIARRLHDPDVTAAGALLYAAALVGQALYLEETEAPGVAVGLRREAHRLLAAAKRQFTRSANHTRLAECWLEEQKLAQRSTPRRAVHAATVTGRHSRAAGLESHALLARALLLQGQASGTTPAAWRQLARSAERARAGEIASRAWLAVAGSLSSKAAPRRAEELIHEALSKAFFWGVRPRPGMASLPVQGGGEGDAPSAARQLALRSARQEPEPKAASLEWVLAAVSASAATGLSSSGARDEARGQPARIRYSVLAAAQLEEARRSGRWQATQTERSVLKRAREACFRALESSLAPIPSPTVPALTEAEALVVFSCLDEKVHTWVVRPPREVVTHICTLDAANWRDAATVIDQQIGDASGWPDAIIPETLARGALTVLSDIGTRIWTPLWPALQGAARVLIVLDPSMPLLPFAALALAAQPESWPRPRSITLVPDPSLERARRWRAPSGDVYAVATRDPVLPVAYREAQGVVRILGGEIATASSLHRDERGMRGGWAASLRSAGLWHVAAPVYSHADHPGFSYVDLGDESLPFHWLAGETHSLRLIVLPKCSREPPAFPALGRVVGLVGPEGARRFRTPPSPKRSEPALYDLARFLLDTGVERVVLNEYGGGDEASPSVVTSAFYAGLARGDNPAEALFLAQRNAWGEKLHPVLWSGYSSWGWP
jgi:tetratricopeptide (TPR) repeat protein